MSRITAAAELSRDELEDAPEGEWLNTLLEKDNQLGRQVVSNINQNLPILNSPVSQLVDLTLVHGVSVTVKNPLSTPIRSVMAVACIGLSVDSTGKPTRGTYNLAMPQIEWHPSGKQNGSVVLTASYPAPMGDVQLSAPSNASIATSGEVFLQWGTAVVGVGSMSFSSGAPTKITCGVAGKIEVWGQLSWAGAAASTRRDCKLFLTNVQQASSIQPGTGGFVFQQASTFLNVVAGDYVELKANHDSATTPLSCAAGDVFLKARYAAPAADTTGKVTLFFAGGE